MVFNAAATYDDAQAANLVPKGKERQWLEFLAAVAEEVACDEETAPIYDPRYTPTYAGPGQRRSQEQNVCDVLRQRSAELAWNLWSDIRRSGGMECVIERALEFIIDNYKSADLGDQQKMDERLKDVDPSMRTAVMDTIKKS